VALSVEEKTWLLEVVKVGERRKRRRRSFMRAVVLRYARVEEGRISGRGPFCFFFFLFMLFFPAACMLPGPDNCETQGIFKNNNLNRIF